jgi:hypothetical protein
MIQHGGGGRTEDGCVPILEETEEPIAVDESVDEFDNVGDAGCLVVEV